MVSVGSTFIREMRVSKQIEIPYILTVLLSIPLNKLPWSDPPIVEMIHFDTSQADKFEDAVPGKSKRPMNRGNKKSM